MIYKGFLASLYILSYSGKNASYTKLQTRMQKMIFSALYMLYIKGYKALQIKNLLALKKIGQGDYILPLKNALLTA